MESTGAIDISTAVQEACRRFGVTILADLGGFGNEVYECRQDGLPCVLKLTDSARRSCESVEKEQDFVHFLVTSGVPVAAPLPSLQGSLVEVIERPDAAPLLARLSEMARGEVLPDEDEIHLPDEQRERLFIEWGRMAGKLHRASRAYCPSSPDWKWIEWNEEREVWDVERHLPAAQTLTKQRIHALYRRLSKLPIDRDVYGLVHCDLHHGNFAIDENGALTLFDFDGLMNSWFMLDISVALYYALPCPPERRAERAAYVPVFLEPFMRGYEMEYHLDPAWFACMPDFLKYSEMADYVIYHQMWDVKDLTEKQARLLARYRDRIDNDIPVVDFDFARWAEERFKE